jgi:tetratricopeptide (TPR) repeat protein
MFLEYFDSFRGRYHRQRGLYHLSKCNFEKALRHFEKALLFAEDMDSRFFYAVCLVSLNQHEKAITHLEQVFEQSPGENLVAATLTECYFVTRQWEKAEVIYEKYSLQTSEIAAIKKFGVMLKDPLKRENYANSKECFFNALKALEARETEQALEYIKVAIEFDDSNASYYYTASLILFKGKKPKQQIVPFLEKAIALSPNNVEFKKQLHYIQTRYKG